MALLGTFINGACILVGSVLGLLFKNIPERFKETTMQGIALVALLIGLQMAFQTETIIIVLLSVVIGALIGEAIQLEERLNQAGYWVGRKLSSNDQAFSPVEGFITATLIFTVGAMAIVGALDGGLRGDHEVLITKGILDGFAALVFASTMGYGVIFAVFPVVIYEGIIALLATKIVLWVPNTDLDQLILLITGVGGLIIIGIALNLLNLTKIRIGNLLPSLVIVIVIYYVAKLIGY